MGLDGKLYPTCHPPVDPATGCQVGHEHGRYPHGSELFSEIGDLPLGFANEQVDTFDPTGCRHEDHVGPCAAATQNGTIAGIIQTDPRSPFNGVRRVMDMNSFDLNNSDGPTTWYTDPFGRGARTTPFPGSIRQYIAKINNTGLDLSGPGIGSYRNYGPPGGHAPH